MAETENHYLQMGRQLEDSLELGEESFDERIDDALMFVSLKAGEFISDRVETEDEYQVALEIALRGLQQYMSAEASAAFRRTALDKLGWFVLDGPEPTPHQRMLTDAFLSDLETQKGEFAGTPKEPAPAVIELTPEDLFGESEEAEQEDEEYDPDDEISDGETVRETIEMAIDGADDLEELHEILESLSELTSEKFSRSSHKAEEAIRNTAKKAVMSMKKRSVKLKDKFQEWLEMVETGERPFSYVVARVENEIGKTNFSLSLAMLDIIDQAILEAIHQAADEHRFRDARILTTQASSPHVTAQLEDVLDELILHEAIDTLSQGMAAASETDRIYIAIKNFASEHSAPEIYAALDVYVLKIASQIAETHEDKAEHYIEEWASNDELSEKMCELLQRNEQS